MYVKDVNINTALLLLVALTQFSCKNTDPLAIKATITSIVEPNGQERIRYEIEEEPETFVKFKTGAANTKQNEKEGYLDPNGRLEVIAPVWSGYDPKYKVTIDAEKEFKNLFGSYVRTGRLDIVAMRKPRILDDHCIIADHQCKLDIAADSITVKGVEVGTTVAIDATQAKATSNDVQISIADMIPKLPATFIPDLGNDNSSDSGNPKFTMTITFPDGAKLEDQVPFAISKLRDKIKVVKPGESLRFGQEPATGEKRGMVFITGEMRMKLKGSAATIAELDLMAKETIVETEVECGTYVSESGNKAFGVGLASLHKVSVWERRTGKVIATREFKPKGNPCRDTIEARKGDRSIYAGEVKANQHLIDDWLHTYLGQ